MTVSINSDYDEDRENEEGCFGAKANATTMRNCPRGLHNVSGEAGAASLVIMAEARAGLRGGSR